MQGKGSAHVAAPRQSCVFSGLQQSMDAPESPAMTLVPRELQNGNSIGACRLCVDYSG